GTAIEHALKGSDLVHLLGFADGSSREFGTHQGPSTSSSCTGEAGALRSGQIVLSCPSSLLRPPPTSSRPPGTSRGHRLWTGLLPGPQIRGRGGSLQFRGQPSGHSEPLAPGGSWASAPRSLMPSMAFALREQARLLLVHRTADRH